MSSPIKKRRKKGSSSSKASTHQCLNCSLCFETSDDLLRHKVDSIDDACRSDLHQCSKCYKYFLTERGLGMHIVKNDRCKREQEIDDFVSILPFQQQENHSSSQAKTYCLDNSTNIGNDSNISVDSEGSEDGIVDVENITFVVQLIDTSKVIPQPTSFKRSFLQPKWMANYRVYEPSSKKDLELFTTHFPPTSLEFKLKCDDQDWRLSLNLDQISNNESLSMTDIHILECLKLTKFKDASITGSLDDILSSFMNHVHLVDAFSDSNSTSFSNEIVIRFVELYGKVHAEADLGSSSSSSSEDGFSDDEVDRGNLSEIPMVQNTDTGSSHNADVAYDMKMFQDCVEEARSDTIFENSEIAKIALLDMLNKANCPKYLFHDILQWASQYGKDLHGTIPSKIGNFVGQMGKKVYGEKVYNLMKPSTTNLMLPRMSSIPVTTFSLKGAITSLLTNPDAMRQENLLLDLNDPYSGPKDSDILDDIDSGWWYRETYSELCVSRKDVLLPLLLFIDGSNIDNNGRLSVEPVTITLGIFNRQMRNRSEAWRTIGFIEDMSNKLSRDKQPSKQSSAKLQDYHAVLDHIFSDLKTIQGANGGFAWTLGEGPIKHDVVFKIAIQVVIGDCKGNDMLCARFGNHSKHTNGFCRDCDVSYHNSDDPSHRCVYISKKDLYGKSDSDLKKLGFHSIINAFDKTCFGARDLGIYGCTPSEPLHSFKLGLCKYLYEGFLNEMPRKTNDMIDHKLSSLIKEGMHQNVGSMPSISVLSKGLNGCATLGGDDQFSRIFGIYLCLTNELILKSLATDERHRKNIKTGVPEKVGAMGLKNALQWQLLIERTVVYFSWLYKETHNIEDFLSPKEYVDSQPHSLQSRTSQRNRRREDSKESRAQIAVRSYLKLFKSVVDRKDGNGLKLVKFHQQLHYPTQILKDGSLLNIDGGHCESIAIENLKKPGSKTQKRLKNLNKQIANNLFTNMILRDSRMLLNISGSLTSPDKREGTKGTRGGSYFTMSFPFPELGFNDCIDTIGLDVEWSGVKYNRFFDSDLINAVAKRLFMNNGEGGCLRTTSQVRGFTEYSINGNTFRCHPCYRGGEPWTDWAMIKWNESDDPIPAKICMFLDLTQCQVMNDEEHRRFCEDVLGNHTTDSDSHEDYSNYEYLSRSDWVVVQSCSGENEGEKVKESKFKTKSTLSCRYRIENQWRLLPIESIDEIAHCIVDEYSSDIICIHDKSTWSEKFYEEI